MKKETKDDIAYGVAKAVLGSIPVVGATASELLQLLVTPQLEKRRNEWMIEVGEKLKQLEQKEELDLIKLANNDVFIDVVLQTTQLALRTSEKEKIQYFKNVILNSAVEENPNITEVQIFLNFISTFTVWHIKILKLFDNPENWFKKNGKSLPNYMAAGLSNVLEEAYPELKGKRELYDLIWDDLSRAGLHKTSGLHTTMTGSGLMVPRTTTFGKEFLEFITESPID
ncbi:hypothetical protein IQ05_00244 [Flavobacterium tiangeerense]|uniref:DUF4393 domain-containing protein n=1 Tax=Flavobacterium tiangeerense TaxID=459471 RepID=A0ABY3FNN7_9FLAO|nr:hypothetical protein [Flavobacterium tiangeerense]TWI03307.1 hypothetical protein IQ05_00244 [Flavobacterium tiangeerense]